MNDIGNDMTSVVQMAEPVLADDLLGTISRLAGRIDLKTLERLHILRTLDSVKGSRKLAVALLGISERTLRHKLRQYRTESAN